MRRIRDEKRRSRWIKREREVERDRQKEKGGGREGTKKDADREEKVAK